MFLKGPPSVPEALATESPLDTAPWQALAGERGVVVLSQGCVFMSPSGRRVPHAVRPRRHSGRAPIL